MIQLIPMTEEAYRAHLAVTIPDYAQEHVTSGRWSPEEALDRASEEFKELLPQGLATPDNYLYTIEDSAIPASVGVLWFAVSRRGKRPVAFVYDVVIHEAHRRRGYASQAFAALEDKVRELGLGEIRLHVFGDNTAARKLYQKLGFVETNVQMAKKLEMF